MALGVFYWWTAEHDGVVELLVHEVVCVLGVGVFYSWTDERVVVVGVFYWWTGEYCGCGRVLMVDR